MRMSTCWPCSAPTSARSAESRQNIPLLQPGWSGARRTPGRSLLRLYDQWVSLSRLGGGDRRGATGFLGGLQRLSPFGIQLQRAGSPHRGPALALISTPGAWNNDDAPQRCRPARSFSLRMRPPHRRQRGHGTAAPLSSRGRLGGHLRSDSAAGSGVRKEDAQSCGGQNRRWPFGCAAIERARRSRM